MRVAIVAGSEAGHALPGLALALRLIGAGHEPVVFTGRQWREVGARYGVDTRELPGLAARPGDDDGDAGAKIHGRAAYIATKVLPGIEEVRADLVVADILTPGGGMAAELLGDRLLGQQPLRLHRVLHDGPARVLADLPDRLP